MCVCVCVCVYVCVCYLQTKSVGNILKRSSAYLFAPSKMVSSIVM